MLLMRFSLVLLFCIAATSVFVSQNNSPLATSIRTHTADITAPALYALSRPVAWIATGADIVRSYFMVHSQNETLEKENRLLKRQLIHLSGVAYENERLQSLLHYVKSTGHEYLSAMVVGSASSPFYRSVTINAGTNDGVHKGMAVVNDQGLAGRIVEAGNTSSRVLLLTDINSNVPVISNSSRERSIMSGNNDDMPQLLYLPKDTKIREGEVILTSGDGELFPYGLQVGTVHKDIDGGYRVRPFVQWHRLEHISLIRNKK